MKNNNVSLVTGGSGKTGLKIIRELIANNVKIRAIVRSDEAKNKISTVGNVEIVYGDLLDDPSLKKAINGCRLVIHICPPMHPKETEIARRVTDHCIANNVERLILYSVLHPLTSQVPHHHKKLEAERYLVNSGQNYTILQPARYMQHITPIWNKVAETGLLQIPFSIHSRFSIVDLDDVALAAATIVVENKHDFATYQLAGPESLNHIEMAQTLSEISGKKIRAEKKSVANYQREINKRNFSKLRIETMLKMNKHYDRHGLIGNANILEWLLHRSPTTFRDFALRDLIKSRE
ncbi:MAG: NAD(P)H-binding protein [Pseudomonadota bacterium]|nr:NAD(P)H-binding protein [Pseudomonadota bacterium]